MAVDAGPLIGVVAGAVVAALGYVGKLAVESWREWRQDRAERLARLLQLQALLRAGRTAFQVQRELAGRLEAQLRHKYPNDLPDEPGFERMFTHLYDRFEPEQAELHSVIRAYTEHALYPTNRAIADWLRADVDYRTSRGTSQPEVRLAKLLNELDCHLTLWLAKHDGWLPDRPDHALVYLVDEERHGLGFPTEIDQAVEDVLSPQR
jgi:hypothetical protein